jgi:hypothetical protein
MNHSALPMRAHWKERPFSHPNAAGMDKASVQ